MPSANDQEGSIWDPCDVNGHGFTIVERVRCDVFWGESKSGRSHSLGIGPDDGDDIGSAN